MTNDERASLIKAKLFISMGRINSNVSFTLQLNTVSTPSKSGLVFRRSWNRNFSETGSLEFSKKAQTKVFWVINPIRIPFLGHH